MDIAIIGAGSIGLLLASYLSEAGLKVTMIVRNAEQSEALREEGICRINEDGSESINKVNASTNLNEISHATLIIIAVKYTDVKEVVDKLKDQHIKAPLLFIQNGIGHLRLVKEGDFPHVSFASVEHGALKSDHRTVNHNGVGKLTIGERFGEIGMFKLLEGAHSDKFPVIRHGNAEHILLRKALINCLINPLTTILKVSNGELLTNPYCHQLMQRLHRELIEAFPEMKSEVSLDAVESVCRQTARNQSSMLTDYLAGRTMEIETIVSATIEIAKGRHRNLPLLETYESMLYVLDGRVAEK